MAKTKANVISSVQARLSKWDSGLETELNSHLEEVIRDICKRYPFWFLKINPGPAFATSFFPGDADSLEAATSVTGYWLGRGWLRLEPDVSRYKVISPAVPGPDHDGTAASWKSTPVQRIDAIYHISPEGTSEGREVPCHAASSSYTASGGAQYSSSTDSVRQVVWENVMESGEAVTYLNVFPTPDDYYLLAVNYTLQYAPEFTVGESTSSSLILHYYETAVAAGMLMAADWYADAPLQEYWTNKLYGKLPIGLIAGMKRDTKTMPFKDRMALVPTNTNPRITQSRGRSRRGGKFDWY